MISQRLSTLSGYVEYHMLWLLMILMLPAVAQDVLSYHPLGAWREITSQYGYRDDPFSNGRDPDFHRGVDMAVTVGDSVYAWRTGVVAYTGYDKISGNKIKIEHAEGYLSQYHHLKRIAVKEGQLVEAGQFIGTAGRSGRVTGPHLHFTLVLNQKIIDPTDYLRSARAIDRSPRSSKPIPVTIYKHFVIKSHPVEGEVKINGRSAGRTPLEIKLPYGEHFVEIDAGSGYQPYVERLWIDQHFGYLFTAHLQTKP